MPGGLKPTTSRARGRCMIAGKPIGGDSHHARKGKYGSARHNCEGSPGSRGFGGYYSHSIRTSRTI
ncbi:UNVERIFIED_CONTAM: hypothetical protein Slati_3694300 [Sesamum latifolium]|uniref:Ribosomal protein L2 n=1 Tax=Sesamum latifolium TaxID=2727402 RepID=A0AAW2U5N3_9LAMI